MAKVDIVHFLCAVLEEPAEFFKGPGQKDDEVQRHSFCQGVTGMDVEIHG